MARRIAGPWVPTCRRSEARNIAALANRTDQCAHPRRAGYGLGDRRMSWWRLVERSAVKIVQSRIDDDEVLASPRLM